MRELQCGMFYAYCNDKIFENILLNAVKDVDACKLAYFKPADSIEELISDLLSSLAIEGTPSDVAVHAHFVDRKYHGQRGQHLHSYANTKYNNNRNQHNHRRSRDDLRCIVCHEKGLLVYLPRSGRPNFRTRKEQARTSIFYRGRRPLKTATLMTQTVLKTKPPTNKLYRILKGLSARRMSFKLMSTSTRVMTRPLTPSSRLWTPAKTPLLMPRPYVTPWSHTL